MERVAHCGAAIPGQATVYVGRVTGAQRAPVPSGGISGGHLYVDGLMRVTEGNAVRIGHSQEGKGVKRV